VEPSVFDVAVVGGSLAGAATAIHLARAGRSVVVLERNAEFKRKACGEGLLPFGAQELERLGILAETAEQSWPLAGVRFHTRGDMAAGAMVGAFGVRRRILDPLLLGRAEAAGVDVRRGVTVRGLLRDGRRVAGVGTDHGDVRARVVIGADGLHSPVRRLAGLEGGRRGNRYGISAHARFREPLAAFVDVHFFGDYELYVTPVGEFEGNVALLTRKPGMRRFAGQLVEEYTRLLASLPGGDGAELLDEPLAAGPFETGCRRPWRANVVLVGDAAGFFDGITGEGMSVALRSARDCAAACDAYLDSGGYEPFKRYAAQRSAVVLNSGLLGRLTLTLGERPPLARMAVRNLRRKPATFDRLLGLNAGTLGLGSLRPGDVLALALGV
jgi:flavin-dependent dehydrogenase